MEFDLQQENSRLREVRTGSEEIFNGTILHVQRDTVRLPNGNDAIREVIRHIGAVCVIPVLDNGDVIMERQYRYPLDRVILEIPEVRPLLGGIAGLLAQLAPDRRKAVLVRRVELAGGDLQDHFIEGIAVLPLHDDLVVVRHGNDADRADVPDDLAHGLAAVGKGHHVPPHMQDDAVEDVFGGRLFFGKPGIFAVRIEVHRNPFVFHSVLRIPEQLSKRCRYFGNRDHRIHNSEF